MAKADTAFRIEPDAGSVGAPVRHCFGHVVQYGNSALAAVRLVVNESSDPAHEQLPKKKR